MRVLTAILCLGNAVAGAAAAQTAAPGLPAGEVLRLAPVLSRVTGVAADDVLNVRAAPSAASGIVGVFAPDQRNIEVMATDASGKWGLVRVGEQTGWAATRYLAGEPDQPAWLRLLHGAAHQDADGLLGAVSCGGTEPFWSLSFSADRAEGDWSPMGVGTGPITYPRYWAGPVANRMPDRLGVIARNGAVDMSGFVELGLCDDGMSDRTYSFRAAFILETGTEAPVALGGCCRIGD